MKYKKYNFILIILVLVNLIAVIIFNIVIDPYKVMHSPTFENINVVKPVLQDNIRLFKAADITHKPPKTVLLGSSRVDVGLNAADFNDLSPTPVYNLGLTGPNMYEVKRYFDHAIATQPNLKEVVLGIDFFMFNQNRSNQPDFKEKRLGTKNIIFSDFLDTTFSITSVINSYKTVKSNLNNTIPLTYLDNGSRNDDYMKTQDNYKNAIEAFRGFLALTLNSPEIYKTYSLSEEYLQNFKAVVDTCRKNKIQLKILISPSHAIQWEAVDVMNLWPTFEQWKREIVKITPVWDFSGYNSITTEPLAKKMENYWDNSHYTKKIGKLIINKMYEQNLNKVPADFGVFLTPENINEHLATIRQQQKEWRKNNPETLEFIEKVKMGHG